MLRRCCSRAAAFASAQRFLADALLLACSSVRFGSAASGGRAAARAQQRSLRLGGFWRTRCCSRAAAFASALRLLADALLLTCSSVRFGSAASGGRAAARVQQRSLRFCDFERGVARRINSSYRAIIFFCNDVLFNLLGQSGVPAFIRRPSVALLLSNAQARFSSSSAPALFPSFSYLI